MQHRMRKSITTLIFVLAAGAAGLAVAQTKAAPKDKGPMQAKAAGPMQLKADAPDRYIVVPGDTLWSISERYTDSPTRWPELWNVNKDEIRNPHRIYPGNVIVLDRSRGTLSVAQTTMAPRVRSEKSDVAAIPSIPANVIEPFLTLPLVIEADGLDRAPQIVATEENRVVLGAGSRVVVSGMGNSKEDIWHVYQKGKALVDPESKDTLGYEAVHLGTARVTAAGEPAQVRIVAAVREIAKGDRLVAAGKPQPVTYLPHAPARAIHGQIIGLYGGIDSVGEGGPQTVVTLNRGKSHGLEAGHVLALHRIGGEAVAQKATDDTPAKMVKLPDERYGLVFVFRVFDRVSYALVMRITRPVNTLDVVRTP